MSAIVAKAAAIAAKDEVVRSIARFILVPSLIGGTRTLPLRAKRSSRLYEATGEKLHTYNYCDNGRRLRRCQGFGRAARRALAGRRPVDGARNRILGNRPVLISDAP